MGRRLPASASDASREALIADQPLSANSRPPGRGREAPLRVGSGYLVLERQGVEEGIKR